MKKYIAMFAIRSESFESALDVARRSCGRTDLTLMEADDRDDMKTLVESIVLPGASGAPQAYPRHMAWSAEVEGSGGWIARMEWCQGSELGAVSILRAGKVVECVVLTPGQTHDLLIGVGAFPYDLIKRCAEERDGDE